ncbi:MAG TPA: hypothetical protein VLG46_12460 [Anaerolineae bacterium]|nr:hypothetical protein [Anaerolineae bacterium]
MSDQPSYRSRSEERAARRSERMEQRQARGVGSGAWIGGAVLILLGIIFLLQNFGALAIGNWWALFILLPAFGAFARAWNLYRMNGRLTAGARWALIGGIMLAMIAVFFLFNLNFGTAWPAFLILTGIGLLLNAMLPA